MRYRTTGNLFYRRIRTTPFDKMARAVRRPDGSRSKPVRHTRPAGATTKDYSKSKSELPVRMGVGRGGDPSRALYYRVRAKYRRVAATWIGLVAICCMMVAGGISVGVAMLDSASTGFTFQPSSYQGRELVSSLSSLFVRV